MKDFFISYNRSDRQYAEWIAWTLEEAGYSVVIQAWDFRPGGNFVLDMQRAAAESQKTIAVLSETYLKSSYTQPEWAAAFAQDPESLERKLIPVRVKECKPEGMLRPIVYVDLVGLSEVDAKTALLEGLETRGKPAEKSSFPETEVSEDLTPLVPVFKEQPEFPSALSRVKLVKENSLQNRLDALIKEHKVTTVQMTTIEPLSSDYHRLEIRQSAIAEKMDQLATEIDELGR